MLLQHKHQLCRHTVKVVLAFEELLHSLDPDKALVPRRIRATSIQYARADNRGEVRQVHAAAGLFVAVRETRHPAQEDEQDFDRVSVRAGKEHHQQVQGPLAFLGCGQCRCRAEQLVQPEGEERVGHLAQEALQQRSELHRVLF